MNEAKTEDAGIKMRESTYLARRSTGQASKGWRDGKLARI